VPINVTAKIISIEALGPVSSVDFGYGASTPENFSMSL
jgi:hypothetical protein